MALFHVETRGTVEPSSWADWAAALAGFLAFGAVIWQQRVETKHRKADIERERRARYEDQARRADEEERSQAETVAGWLAPKRREVPARGYTQVKMPRADLSGGLSLIMSHTDPVAYIRNGSQVPIYDVVVLMVPVQGAAPRNGEAMGFENHGTVRRFLVMPPGTYWTELKSPPGGMHIRFGVEVAFRDAAGKAWVRRGNGTLEPLNGESPFTGRIEDLAADPDSLYEVANS